MKIKSRVRKSAILILLVCSIVIGGNLLTGNPGEDRNLAQFGDALFLVKPAFAQSTNTTFPEDEAGVSAYVNVGQGIDLGKVKGMLRGIEAEGDTYVIGIVELTGLPEEEFPHVYVSRDGWIVAYYSKFAPTSRIMQWYGYGGGKITTTTIEDAIAKLCINIGIDYLRVKGNIKYYHFKYPEATQLIIAVDTITSAITTDTFIFSIPFGVVCYEASWSHYTRDLSHLYNDYSEVEIDGTQISYIRYKDPVKLKSGTLEESQLKPDKVHTVSIELATGGAWGALIEGSEFVGVVLVFVYK